MAWDDESCTPVAVRDTTTLPILTDSAAAVDRSSLILDNDSHRGSTFVDEEQSSTLMPPDTLASIDGDLGLAGPVAEAGSGCDSDSSTTNGEVHVVSKEEIEDKKMFKEFCTQHGLNRQQYRQLNRTRKKLGKLFGKQEAYIARLKDKYPSLIENMESDTLHYGVCITESYGGMGTAGHAANQLLDTARLLSNEPSFHAPFWVYSVTENNEVAQRCLEHTIEGSKPLHRFGDIKNRVPAPVLELLMNAEGQMLAELKVIEIAYKGNDMHPPTIGKDEYTLS